MFRLTVARIPCAAHSGRYIGAPCVHTAQLNTSSNSSHGGSSAASSSHSHLPSHPAAHLSVMTAPHSHTITTAVSSSFSSRLHYHGATAHCSSLQLRTFTSRSRPSLATEPPTSRGHNAAQMNNNISSTSYFLDPPTVDSRLGEIEHHTHSLPAGATMSHHQQLQIEQMYANLMTDTLQTPSSQLAVEQALRILRSCSTNVPVSSAASSSHSSNPIHDRLIQDLVRFHISHNIRLINNHNLSLTTPQSAPKPSRLDGSPMAIDYQTKELLQQPKDIFRDILELHKLILSPETRSLLFRYVACRKDSIELTALLQYFRENKHDQWIPSLDEFNSALEVFGEETDIEGAMILFSQLESQSQFSHLQPNIETYRAFLLGLITQNSYELIQSILVRVIEMKDPEYERIKAERNEQNMKEIDQQMMERWKQVEIERTELFADTINKLISRGHLVSALQTLLSMDYTLIEPDGSMIQENTKSIYKLQASEACFLPMLMELPRYTPEQAAVSQSDKFTQAASPQILSNQQRYEYLHELYKIFRSLSYEVPDAPLAVLIERTMLLGSGMEVVSLNETAQENTTTTAATIGFTERNLEVITRSQPDPDRPDTRQLVETMIFDRFAPAMQQAQQTEGPVVKTHLPTPSIEFLNGLLYLYGVVYGNLTMMQELYTLGTTVVRLHPNIHTLNLLMESYGRFGTRESVRQLYDQVKASEQSNIQTFNTVLNYLDGSLGEPFRHMSRLVDDMIDRQVAPNHTTWIVVARKFVELSGNAEAEARTQAGLLIGGMNGVATGAGAVQTFPPPYPMQLTQGMQHLVYQIFQKLLMAQQAANASTDANAATSTPTTSTSPSSIFSSVTLPSAASPLSTKPVSSLTGDVLDAYVTLSAKLNDHGSLMMFLRAMERCVEKNDTNGMMQKPSDAATSTSSTSDADSNLVDELSSLLPTSYCFSYFISSRLSQHIYYRLLQLDFSTCVELISIWSSASRVTGRQNINQEHFSFLKRLHGQELKDVLQLCVEKLVTPFISNTPHQLMDASNTTDMTYRHIANHLYKCLLTHAPPGPVVEYLNLLAALPRNVADRIWPSDAFEAVARAIKSVAASTLQTVSPASEAGQHAITVRDERLMDLISKVLPSGAWHGFVSKRTVLDEIITMSRTGSRPNDAMFAVHDQARVPQLISLWRAASSLLGDDAFLNAHNRNKPAGTTAELMYPQFNELTHRLMRALAPSSSSHSHKSSFIATTAHHAAKVVSANGVSLRTSMLREIVAKHVTFLTSRLTNHPIVHRPLIDVATLDAALDYAIRVGDHPTIVSLFRYAVGRSVSEWSTYYTNRKGELDVDHDLQLPGRAGSGWKLPVPLLERLMIYSAPRMGTNEDTPLFESLSHFTGRRGVERSIIEGSVDTALAWEVYAQLRLEQRVNACSIEALRALIRLQARYPESATSYPVSSSSPPPSSILGVSQLMLIWKRILETRAWWDAYSLLPSMLRSLTAQTHLSLDTRRTLVQMLQSWHDGVKQRTRFSSAEIEADASTDQDGKSRKGGRRKDSAAWRRQEEAKLIELHRIVNEEFIKAKDVIAKASAAALGSTATTATTSPSSSSIVPASSSSTTRSVLPPGSLSVTSAKIVALQRVYSSLLTHVPLHPPTTQKPGFSNDVLPSLSKIVSAKPKEFMMMTRKMIEDGDFEKWRKSEEGGSSDAASSSSPAVVTFFTSLLRLFHARQQQDAFVTFMLAVSSVPDAMKTCFGGAAALTFAAATNAADEDAFLRVLRSILPADDSVALRSPSTSPDLAAFFPPPSTSPRGSRSLALDLQTRDVRLVASQDLVRMNAPSWWVCQLLYWHYRLHRLPIHAFHPTSLMLLPVRQDTTAGQAHAQPSMPSWNAVPRQGAINQYSLSPRAIEEWWRQAASSTNGQVESDAEIMDVNTLIQMLSSKQQNGRSTSASSSPSASSPSITSPLSFKYLLHRSYLHTYRFLLFELDHQSHSERLDSSRIRALNDSLAATTPTTTPNATQFSISSLNLSRSSLGLSLNRLDTSMTSSAPQSLQRALQQLTQKITSAHAQTNNAQH